MFMYTKFHQASRNPKPTTHIILSWTPFSSNSMERFSENDRQTLNPKP